MIKRADKVWINPKDGQSIFDEVTGGGQPVVSEAGVESNNDRFRILFIQNIAGVFEILLQIFGAKYKEPLVGCMLFQVVNQHFIGNEHLANVGRSAHFFELFFVKSGVFGRIVGVEMVVLTAFFHLVDEINRAVKQAVA